jgi:glutathione S-transferase
MLTAYIHPYSQHSRRVLALLEIAGADYKTEVVALDEGEHMSPAFLAVNPNHQVPALIDNGLTLSESNAILRYLCGKFELTDWYPPELGKRAIVDQWLDWNQCRLSRPVIDIVLNKVFLGDEGDRDAIVRGEADLVELGALLAKHLSVNTWLAGDGPTIADLSVASNITQLGLADAIPDRPPIHDWYARVCEIEGFRNTLPPPMDAAA